MLLLTRFGSVLLCVFDLACDSAVLENIGLLVVWPGRLDNGHVAMDVRIGRFVGVGVRFDP